MIPFKTEPVTVEFVMVSAVSGPVPYFETPYAPGPVMTARSMITPETVPSSLMAVEDGRTIVILESVRPGVRPVTRIPLR